MAPSVTLTALEKILTQIWRPTGNDVVGVDQPGEQNPAVTLLA